MNRCLKGQFLIASPYLTDRNFFRSVVLLVSHDEEHAFGFLLNRCTHESVADYCQRQMDEMTSDRRELVRSGGPLKGPLMLIHDSPASAEAQVAGEVYITSSKEMVEDALTDPLESLIPITGYSGWGPGQLEAELQAGGWMALPADREIVFCDPEQMWQMASTRIAQKILPGFRSRHVPSDPQMN